MDLSYFDKEKLSKSKSLMALIKAKVHGFSHHKIYGQLTSSARINSFMSHHIFVIWDLVRLLKSLHDKTNIALKEQDINCFACTENAIEKIASTEESNFFCSQTIEQFALYLCVLSEIKVDHSCLYSFAIDYNSLKLNPGIRELIKYSLTLTETGTIGEILVAFFCGREQLTSQVFTPIIETLNREGKEFSILASYTKKLNQEESYPFETFAFELLDYFCKDETDKVISLQAGLKAINLRKQVWDYALAEMEKT